MAIALDLEEPTFLQADLLRLVPGLSAGTLQNWIARKVIEVDFGEKAGKHAKVYWSPISAIAFRIMVEMTRLGLKASQAFTISDTLIQEIDSFLERFDPTPDETGFAEFVVDGGRMQDYRQFRIVQNSLDGAISVMPINPDAGQEALVRGMFVQEYATIVIELDILFGSALNAVLRLRAGRDPSTGKSLKGNG